MSLRSAAIAFKGLFVILMAFAVENAAERVVDATVVARGEAPMIATENLASFYGFVGALPGDALAEFGTFMVIFVPFFYGWIRFIDQVFADDSSACKTKRDRLRFTARFLTDFSLIMLQAVFFIALGKSVGGDLFREVLIGLFVMNILWGGIATLMHHFSSYDVGTSGPWKWSALNIVGVAGIIAIEERLGGSGLWNEWVLFAAMTVRTGVDFVLMAWWYVDGPNAPGPQAVDEADPAQAIIGPSIPVQDTTEASQQAQDNAEAEIAVRPRSADQARKH